MISDLQTVAEYLPPSPPSKTLSVSHDVFEGDTTLVDQNTPAAALSQAKQDSRPQLAQLPDDISMISLADHPFCALVSEAPLDSQVWDPPNNWESKYWTVLSQLEDAQARIALTEQLEHLASTVDPTAFGPRDNIIALRRKYDRLIQYTLTTRREAREWKKMAIYWEARARQGEASRGKLPSDSITPSASDVSEVAEPLTPERIKAVENLLRRRRGSILVETGSTRESVLERIGQALHSASTSSHSIQSAASSSSSSSDSTVRATSSTPTATTRSSSIVHDDFEPASSSPNSGLLLGVLSSQPLGDISNSAHNRPASLLKAPNQKIVGRMSSLGAAHQGIPISPRAMKEVTARRANHSRTLSRERALALSKARDSLALANRHPSPLRQTSSKENANTLAGLNGIMGPSRKSATSSETPLRRKITTSRLPSAISRVPRP